MKIRMGFVSNSSSSSFCVLLPRNFDPAKFDFTKLSEYDDAKEYIKNISNELVAEEMQRLIDNGGMREDEMQFSMLIETVLRQVGYVLAIFSHGPEDGQIAVVTADEVEDFLNKKEN